MTYTFNEGQYNQVTVAQLALGSYMDNNNTNRQMLYPVTMGEPFDLSPLMRRFLASASDNVTPLFKDITSTICYGWIYGIIVSQLNDVITCSLYEDRGAGPNPRSTPIYSTTVTNVNNYAPVYFYYNHDPSDGDVELRVGYHKYKRVSTQAETVGENTWLFGAVPNPTEYYLWEFTELGAALPTPYNVGDFCLTPSMFAVAPQHCIYPYDHGQGDVVLYNYAPSIPELVANADGTAPVTPEEPPFEPSNPTPYAPDPDDSSDQITLPTDPAIGITNAGFINVYKPGVGALQGLGNYIFPNVAHANDIVEAVVNLCNALSNSNLINYVIDCHVIPVSPVTGTNSTIKVGYKDTGISVPLVIKDYVDVSCGSLNIAEYFGGFADYAATRSKIYLPFLGFVDTRPEFWQAGTISIDYKFNIIDGSFMVFIRSTSSKSNLTGTVIAQYGGNACMHFPLTGVNYSNMVSGIIGSVASGIAQGTPTAVAGGIASAVNIFSKGGDVQQSNGYNSTSALLGVRTPYMMIERPVTSYPGSYAHDKGYPTNITASLSQVSGYTEIEDIDLSGIPFTADELTELKQLLSEGVYF